MTFFIQVRSFVAISALCFTALLPSTSHATIVEFETSLGNFEVNLYDNATPQTVANFLDYVQNGRYTDSIFHRSVANFVIQGGGFNTDARAEIGVITAGASVVNEPEYSNVRGTISMAKVAGNPNSATSQWFFNVVDNSNALDGQNGGFTAFGEVIGNGMAVVDALAALPRYNIGSPLTELPLRNYTSQDAANNLPIDNTHLLIISSITVTDTTVDSAAGLNPTPNTANDGGGSLGGGGGGGGSTGLFLIFGLCAARLARLLHR
ncbi:MAG: peptidylprolyl isomerase [Woeseia sp.]